MTTVSVNINIKSREAYRFIIYIKRIALKNPYVIFIFSSLIPFYLVFYGIFIGKIILIFYPYYFLSCVLWYIFFWKFSYFTLIYHN